MPARPASRTKAAGTRAQSRQQPPRRRARGASPAHSVTATSAPARRVTARTTIEVRGARVHNLKNVSVEIPRDALVVVTGLSGSGKSSLAFDTIYAEGQRRYMESLSSYAKRFIAQVEKPDVDFVNGLSPVISIEQKTVARNPRSTVGTLTDIASYLNLLYATAATATCPFTGEPAPIRTASQIVEAILDLPAGATVELRAPLFDVYGEDLEFVLNEVRKQGCRHVLIDEKRFDLADAPPKSRPAKATLWAVVDQLVVDSRVEKQLKAAVYHTLRIGDGLLAAVVTNGAAKSVVGRFDARFGTKTWNLVFGEIVPDYFMFNNPESACRTCGGLGTYKQTHPDLLVSDPSRSIRGGCFQHEAFAYKPDTHRGYTAYTVCKRHGIDLDAPWSSLTAEARQIFLYGTGPEPVQLEFPPDAKVRKEAWLKWPTPFSGIAGGIERRYRWYRQRGEANTGMEDWLSRVMVEHTCPDCRGARLRPTRRCFTLLAGGRAVDIAGLGQLNLDELLRFVSELDLSGDNAEAGRLVAAEIGKRIDLLVGIGLDYLNLNRASGTLSGGEAQRIRLSTQIGSGLMGMLYVLDEPSIGLHPRDNVRMIETLRTLRDLGNTVIVVEHDEDTIRAADHIVELGPGPGVHGGEVVVSGALDAVLQEKRSPTGQFLSGARTIPTPSLRRPPDGRKLTIRGARENNLKNIDVDIPLGQLICVSGASGSGKSTLVAEILFKRLWKELVDTRTLAGDHDRIDGIGQVARVVNIDQSPIGRSSRSNPATYVGFYDLIRALFARTEVARERSYQPGRFSFNVKGGRCEDCQGEGVIATKLYFMPDVEVVCTACKGRRFTEATLDATYNGKNIADVLDLSIEEGVAFFAQEPGIARKLEVLNELGLGYLTLGQSSTTLSGGEAQRIKLGAELAKVTTRGHVLYILDEPTTGLHVADVSRLLDCMQRLVDAGNTVLVIEHHLDVIKSADHVIDLGPDGGRGGGEVIAQGTPEAIAANPRSHTGRFLKARL